MKKLLICAAAVFMLSCNNDKKNTTATSSTDTSKMAAVSTPGDTAQAPPMDSAAMMKAWQTYMTPGDAQKRMAMANGKWTEDMTMYMPGAAPQTMKSDCENTMILNGLYQRSEHHGMYNGMKFEGISTMAYNIAAKKYQSTWIDNMGSGMMNMEGDYDSTAKTYNMKGTETDPMTGKDIPVRETFKLIDDKNQYMEMFETRSGKEAKTMEIKFTKQ
jgi:hypothetical protein